MAKRKKRVAASKRNKKAVLARAEKRRRKLAALAAAATVGAVEREEPDTAELTEAPDCSEESISEAAPACTERESEAEKKTRRTMRKNPLGSIKHGYGASFVSQRESARIVDRAENHGEQDMDFQRIDALDVLTDADYRMLEGNDALRFSRFSEKRDRYADIENLPDFTSIVSKDEIREEYKNILKNDISATLLRFEYRSTLLKDEIGASARSFLKRAYGTDERDVSLGGRRVRRVKRKAHGALKYEKLDNSRYYGALLDAYDRLAAPSAEDKVELNALVTELYELIARRDEVNRRLIALYGAYGTGHTLGKRDAANIKAQRRECRKYERLYHKIIEAKIELRSRDKLLGLMDEQVKRAGDIAECKYALSRGHLGQVDHLAVKRRLRSMVAEYKKMRVEIDHKARKLIRQAYNRRSANIAALFGWIGFALVLVLACVVAWNWDAFVALAKRCASAVLAYFGR